MNDLEKLSILSKIVYGFYIQPQISLITVDKSTFISTTFNDKLLSLIGYNIDDIQNVLKKMSILKNVETIEVTKNKKGFKLIEGNNIVTVGFSDIEMFNHLDGSEKSIPIEKIMNKIELLESLVEFSVTKEQISEVFTAMKTFEIKEEIFINIHDGKVYFEFYSKNATSSYQYYLLDIDNIDINLKLGVKIPIYASNWDISIYSSRGAFIRFKNDDFTFIVGYSIIESDDDLFKIINK